MTRLICTTADHSDLGSCSTSLVLCLYALRSSNYIHPTSLPTPFPDPPTCRRNLRVLCLLGPLCLWSFFPETSLTHLCSVSALLWPQPWIFLTPCLISSPYDPLHPMTLWPTSVLQQTLSWGNCYSVPSLCLDPGSSPTASILFSSVSPQKLLAPASPVPPTSLLCMEFCPLIYLKNILATPLGTWNLISSTTDSPLHWKHSVRTTGPPRKS